MTTNHTAMSIHFADDCRMSGHSAWHPTNLGGCYVSIRFGGSGIAFHGTREQLASLHNTLGMLLADLDANNLHNNSTDETERATSR
jgi:hypothetical protein